jgi:hypothetical protein
MVLSLMSLRLFRTATPGLALAKLTLHPAGFFLAKERRNESVNFRPRSLRNGGCSFAKRESDSRRGSRIQLGPSLLAPSPLWLLASAQGLLGLPTWRTYIHYRPLARVLQGCRPRGPGERPIADRYYQPVLCGESYYCFLERSPLWSMRSGRRNRLRRW